MVDLKTITGDGADQETQHRRKDRIQERIPEGSPQWLLFSIKCVPGSRRPRDTSVDVFVAAEIIQYSGNTEIKDTIPRKIYVGINLLWIIDLLFCLVTRITYFQVDKCKDRYHDKDQK